MVTPPLSGLGTTVELIERIVKDNEGTLDLLNQALQRPAGNPTGNNQYSSGINNNVINSTMEQGNSTEYALRRLRDQRPDLHTQVLTKELSPHAAMVLAGFRHRTVTIPVDDVDRMAKTLRRHLNEYQTSSSDITRFLQEWMKA